MIPHPAFRIVSWQRLSKLLLIALASQPALAQQAPQSVRYKTEIVATGLEHPWALVQLPDERWLVTERAGRMRFISKDGALSKPLQGVPTVFHEGQGGLLDITLDPHFSENPQIYFTYAEAEGDNAGTAVARATLASDRLENVAVIFRQNPKVDGGNHFGSRLRFAPDGTLFIGLGERFDYSAQAQKLDNHLGKVIRIKADGSVPADNPYVNRQGALPEIWSYGHRNIQGMAVHPTSGAVWIHEHGPRGGDEINIPQAGKNYGWPEVSYGSHYSLIPIPDEHAKRGYIEPIYYWTPSIAPSGMMFYSGKLFPEWKGNLFLGALATTHLARLELNGQKITQEEKLLGDLEARIRDVKEGKDGAIYVLTDDSNGQLLKLVPAP